MIEAIIVSSLVATLVTLLIGFGLPKLKQLIEKLRAPFEARIGVPFNVAIIDGSNVALHRSRKKGKLENILLVSQALESRGFKTKIVVDASLRYKIDKPHVLERLIQTNKVIQVPSGTPADYWVLALAEAEGGIVISNDAFREWAHLFPWVKDRRRVIRYLIDDHKVFFYPDVRPWKKYKKKSVKKVICIDVEGEERDWSKYYLT